MTRTRRFEFVVELPEGFDHRTRLLVLRHRIRGKYGVLVAFHPDRAPVVVNMDTGEIRPLIA